jgi:hypothetical protein
MSGAWCELDGSIVPTGNKIGVCVYMARVIRARNIGTCKSTPTGTRVQSPTGKVIFSKINKGSELFVPRDIALTIAQELHRWVKSHIEDESLQEILHKDFEKGVFPWKVSIKPSQNI